ncbi:glycoside hydrolase family 99-like domain-containing protein, partial [Nostoc sp. NIES-2111]
MEQTYSPENDIAFIDSVIPFFRDPRHLRVNGAPALVVYRPQHMPNARATAERWRARCREAGIGEIHLIAALTHGNDDFEQFGFDAGVEFPPHNVNSPPRQPPKNLADKLDAPEPLTGVVWDYGEVARSFIAQDHAGRRVYRGVFPAWDNTARVGTRADFYWTLHAVFVKKHEHSDVFTQAFRLFWRRKGLIEKIMATMSPTSPKAKDEPKKPEAGSLRAAQALLKDSRKEKEIEEEQTEIS